MSVCRISVEPLTDWHLFRGAVIIFDTIYYYKQQALDCFRHSDGKKQQKVKKVRKNTGGTGESDVSSLPSLSSLYLPRFHFFCATFQYLKVWNRLHKRLFDSNGLVHHCLLR